MKINKYFEQTSNKYLASEEVFRQIWGAILKQWWLLVLILAPLAVAMVIFIADLFYTFVDTSVVLAVLQNHWCQLFFLTLSVWLAISACRTLTNIFSLRKKEAGITWCQLSILIAIGCWIIGFLIIFDMRNYPRYTAAMGIAGTLLAWIFQDTIKGVVAFIHLRLNNLLCIEDWIQIPKYHVDGEVKRVTLTTVTIYNWDTTTSSIPTSVLHTDHFINLKKMLEGKTYGRRMIKTFILDTGWFHAISKEEAARLQQSNDIVQYLPKEMINEGVTNAHLYRIYLFHWLMNHPHVSQHPNLIVRWMEQTESGMPLQVYAFITDSSSAAFEWQQSAIIEHIMKSLEWFGLRLFQIPSSYDASSRTIFIPHKPATYRNE